VAELDLVGGSTLGGSKMEPPYESSGRLFHRGPEAVACVALVVAEDRRQELVLDLVARRRPTAVYEVHHFWITVELDEVFDVLVGEPAQLQPLGFQKDL